MKKRSLLIAVVVLGCSMFARAADDIVIADFEGADYAGWATTGDAFGTAPAHGTLPNQQNVDGFVGHGLVNSYLNGDETQGSLTSPSFTINRKFITFLIGGGNNPGRECINLVVNDKIVRTATGSDGEHLEGYTWDTKELQGKDATIEIVDTFSGGWGHINVDQIVQTDNPAVAPLNDDKLYAERHRPQFHFTSQTGWINDPNGMVFYGGEYHLFFQHNPKGNQWGNMTWGHATSADMIHWQQLDNAIEPDALGTIFSGSAIVDWNNTSGFAKGNEKTLVAMYTAAGGTNPESKGKKFSQCIAYSNDKGRTWTKYAGNPVIKWIVHENRDPKLVWYAPEKKWIVALYKDGSTYALFSSKDLKTWTHLQDQDLPGCSECPDFFSMPVDGDATKVKWVFTAADGKYLVGDFDGKSFNPETAKPLQVDFGRNYYAVQTFSDSPDGRRVQMSWMRDGKYPHMPFNGQMSFPSEMQLKTTPDGLRIFRTPIKEIESLHGEAKTFTNVAIKPGDNLLDGITGDLFHIVADFEVGDADTVGLQIFNEPIVYSKENHRLSALGEAPLELDNGHLYLDVLVDRTTIETYANHGKVSLTSCFLPVNNSKPLSLSATGNGAKIVSLSVFPLKSAWPSPDATKQ